MQRRGRRVEERLTAVPGGVMPPAVHAGRRRVSTHAKVRRMRPPVRPKEAEVVKQFPVASLTRSSSRSQHGAAPPTSRACSELQDAHRQDPHLHPQGGDSKCSSVRPAFAVASPTITPRTLNSCSHAKAHAGSRGLAWAPTAAHCTALGLSEGWLVDDAQDPRSAVGPRVLGTGQRPGQLLGAGAQPR